MYLQPKHDIGTGGILGAEALIAGMESPKRKACSCPRRIYCAAV